MGIFQSDAGYRLSDIKEIVQGKRIRFLLQSAEFSHLFHPFINGVSIISEVDFIGFLLAQSTQTMAFQQCAYFVETYLGFKVLRVNHATKLLIFALFCKKVLEKFA